MALAAAGNVRIIDNRRFELIDSVWTDARVTSNTRTVRVKPYSKLYFDLMTRIDDLSKPFSLGDRVVVGGRAVAIALDPRGLESMDNSALQALLRDW